MFVSMIAGNLGKAAELKTLPSGKTVCNFSVAVKDREKKTKWVDCSLWGARGEAIARYLEKGTKVAIVGTQAEHEHQGKTYTKLDVLEIALMGDKSATKDEVAQDEIPF